MTHKGDGWRAERPDAVGSGPGFRRPAKVDLILAGIDTMLGR